MSEDPQTQQQQEIPPTEKHEQQSHEEHQEHQEQQEHPPQEGQEEQQNQEADPNKQTKQEKQQPKPKPMVQKRDPPPENAVIFDFEVCRNCDKHAWCTHHDEERYTQLFLDCRTVLESEIPNAYCTYNEKWKLPGTGAFDVYHKGHVIYSKKDTQLFPNPYGLLERVNQFLDDFNNKKDMKDWAKNKKTVKYEPPKQIRERPTFQSYMKQREEEERLAREKKEEEERLRKEQEERDRLEQERLQREEEERLRKEEEERLKKEEEDRIAAEKLAEEERLKQEELKKLEEEAQKQAEQEGEAKQEEGEQQEHKEEKQEKPAE